MSAFDLALSRPVVRRALGYGVVVGAILIGINHGDALWRGEFAPLRLFKMGLTVLVPYTVSTLSSVQALQSDARDRADTSKRYAPNPTQHREE